MGKLCTLCGVQACAIIYSAYGTDTENVQPRILYWSKDSEVSRPSHEASAEELDERQENSHAKVELLHWQDLSSDLRLRLSHLSQGLSLFI